MPTIFDVDGDRIEDPQSKDIAGAFEKLDKRPSGWFSGPGLSLIILQRDEANLLMATGTYATGFLLVYQDGDPNSEYNSDFNQPVPADKVIKIFQAYAENKDWGKAEFKWEHNVTRDKTSNIVKRVGLYFAGFVLLVLVLKYVLKII